VPFIVRWPKKITAGGASDQLLCLNDLFATCAEILGDTLPTIAAEDSFSFLPNLLGQAAGAGARTNLVSHSVNGEFAYREDGWKIVFKMPDADLAVSRGNPAVVQLYNLDDDIAEQKDLADQHPEIVARLTGQLQNLVDRGCSRPGPPVSNDTHVRFDMIQNERWGPALK
jgi:arylsulfatase A-like enzyme